LIGERIWLGKAHRQERQCQGCVVIWELCGSVYAVKATASLSHSKEGHSLGVASTIAGWKQNLVMIRNLLRGDSVRFPFFQTERS
jgi:hypothetical protein